MDEDSVEHWIRPAVRSLIAYHVPDAEGFVKLDAMENPYTWPESLIDDWLKVIKGVHLNRYPDAGADRLKLRLREYLQVPAGCSILLGNGSDELIQMLLMALGGKNRTLVTPEPGFAMYRIISAMTGLGYVGVPLNPEDFSLDAEAMLNAIKQHKPALVFLAYPNNPTGNLFDRDAITAIIEASPGLVVLDEAYFSFANSTFMDVLPEYENLLVMRTLSKIGLAGLRIGILCGSGRWLNEIDKVRLPYNINSLSQVSAEFILEHVDVLEEQTARIRSDRENLNAQLGAMTGIETWPSHANFLLCRARGNADRLFESLKREKILIKNLNGSHPLLGDCLRVTVGSPQENEVFVTALDSFL